MEVTESMIVSVMVMVLMVVAELTIMMIVVFAVRELGNYNVYGNSNLTLMLMVTPL